jgi:glycosyltransferase involved in cell wall biosynthesis
VRRAARLMPRILCLDIEGGYGGSSRSLFESLQHMDRTDLEIEVWCGRSGPIQARYAELGIACRVMPDMPRWSALPRLSRNLASKLQYALGWRRAQACRDALRSCGADLIHCNHESLAGLAAWLRRHVRATVTMHIRTQLPPGPFARSQVRRIARSVDGLIFITENERDTFSRHLGGHPLPDHKVIYNIASAPVSQVFEPIVPRDDRLVIACLSNFAWVRGTDRVVDLAVALKAMGRQDVRFLMAGNMAMPGSLPGKLGEVARQGGDLKAYATLMGVEDSMQFLGHVSQPERVLAAADLLIKPTREANPWGRDILEALAAGRPVLSVGRYDRFVEDGVTGILQAGFDAADLARRVAGLADNRAEIVRMGERGMSRIAELCDGAARGADLHTFWLARSEANRG